MATQGCGHEEQYLWYRTVGDTEMIDMAAPFCVRCELTRLNDKVERLTVQALAISETLRHLGIGPCTLPEGVLELMQMWEKAEEKATALALQSPRTQSERLSTTRSTS